MRAIFIIGFLLTLILIFTACDDGTTTPTSGNTPAQVLRSLIYAFNRGDIETLEGALADDFTFHFDVNDVGSDVGGYIIPVSWGREDFLSACGNMFEDAYSIDLIVEYETVAKPDDGITEFTVYSIYVRLLVMVDAQNGYVAQDFCDFRFVNGGADGTNNWVIADWWDKTVVRGTFESTETSPLGSILAGFAE